MRKVAAGLWQSGALLARLHGTQRRVTLDVGWFGPMRGQLEHKAQKRPIRLAKDQAQPGLTLPGGVPHKESPHGAPRSSWPAAQAVASHAGSSGYRPRRRRARSMSDDSRLDREVAC